MSILSSVFVRCSYFKNKSTGYEDSFREQLCFFCKYHRKWSGRQSFYAKEVKSQDGKREGEELQQERRESKYKVVSYQAGLNFTTSQSSELPAGFLDTHVFQTGHVITPCLGTI